MSEAPSLCPARILVQQLSERGLLKGTSSIENVSLKRAEVFMGDTHSSHS